MSDSIKKIIGLIVALAAFGLVIFYLVLDDGATVVGPENMATGSGFPEVDRAQEMLRDVKRVRIDTDLLESDEYRALVNRQIVIPPQEPGNSQPFRRTEEFESEEGISVINQISSDIPQTIFNVGPAVGEVDEEN